MTRGRVVVVCAVLGLVLVGVAVLSVLAGSGSMDLGRALDGTLEPNRDRDILLLNRLPRVALGALAGGALALVGAAFQGLLRNPLADPFILGVSGGAALGGSLAIAIGVVGSGSIAAWSVPAASFVGALASLALVYTLSLRGGRLQAFDVLLVGVVFNSFASALIMFLKTVVGAQKAQEMLYWLMGTLSVERIGGPELLATTTLVALGGAVLLVLARPLDLLALGDEAAEALGVPVEGVKRAVFAASSLVIGAIVSVTGLVGFVGLVVPHAVRLVAGPDHRLVLPASTLAGAIFLLLADLGARVLFPVLETDTPVGVVTAFVGGPVFVWLLHRSRRPLGGEL